MDKIFIQELKIETIIGILPHERKQKQPLIIDIEIACDIKKAAKSENITDALDYKYLADRITDYVASSQFQLLETLAEHLAALIFKEFQPSWLRLQISKPTAIAHAKAAGIIIERKLHGEACI